VRRAGAEAGVEGGEFADEDTGRPAVRNDVMKREEEEMEVVVEREQEAADEGRLP
jgi:hypothetical protein